MGMLKVSKGQVFGTAPPQYPSPKTAGQSFRKVSNLFRHDRWIMRVFDSGERRLPVCSRKERRDQYPREGKREKELASLCAMNEKQVSSPSPGPVGKPLSLEQMIDLIDKDQEVWGVSE
jgi:hypothetical protein